MDRMSVAEVTRVRAAYGLAASMPIGPTERDELASLLLAGTREYNLEGPEYTAWRAKHEEEYMVQRRKGQQAASEQRARLRARRKQAQQKKEAQKKKKGKA